MPSGEGEKSLEDLLEMLADYIACVSDARGEIFTLLRELYEEKGLTLRFGSPPQLWKVPYVLAEEFEKGELTLKGEKNPKICRGLVCIDADKLLAALEKYYTCMGGKAKIMHEVER